MLCEQCGKHPATIHFTQVINGEKTEMALCAECARERGSISMGEAASLLAGLLEGGAERAQAESGARCSRCGRSYAQFRKTGLLGCAQCYQDFRTQLSPMLKRIHGRLQHEGHIPASAGEGLRLRREIEGKRREMQTAIEQEAFERAASLRDELRTLQAALETQPAADGSATDQSGSAEKEGR